MLSLFCVPVLGLVVAVTLRTRSMRWTWALAAAPVVAPVRPVAAACVLAAVVSARWHRADLRDGGDCAQRAARRRGPLDALRRTRSAGVSVVSPAGLAVGLDDHDRPVRVALGDVSGRHMLIVGATGSGKTVTEAWVLARAIESGHGAVVIDPKGDRLLRDQAAAAAARMGREFIEWTPDGTVVYNPYAHGTASEIADKALAAEPYSEPHYLRQAQRYIGHAVRTLRAAGQTPNPARLLELMDPQALEVLARSLPDERESRAVFAYLDQLDNRSRGGLAGTRDRLAILAESELGAWLAPGRSQDSAELDLLEAVRRRAVVYFRLDADRLPLLARMLAAAIVQDLLTVAADLQGMPVPTLVAIDEFSAIAAASVARLFGRARAAGFSLLLATQELADLRTGGGELLEQVLGNLATLIAHRQTVPDSAELVAGIGGTHGVWQATERVERGAPTGAGSRTRAREYLIHPDLIKTLPTGTAAVIVAEAGTARLARVFHP